MAKTFKKHQQILFPCACRHSRLFLSPLIDDEIIRRAEAKFRARTRRRASAISKMHYAQDTDARDAFLTRFNDPFFPGSR